MERGERQARHGHTDDVSRADIEKMTAIGEKYSACYRPHVPPPPVDAGIPADAGPPRITSPAKAQAVLRAARDFAGGDRAARIDVAYVGSDGVLDPEFGGLTARFGSAPVSGDDPRRRTGVPVQPPPERTAPCKRMVWGATAGWSFEDVPCKPVAAVGPRCRCPRCGRRRS